MDYARGVTDQVNAVELHSPPPVANRDGKNRTWPENVPLIVPSPFTLPVSPARPAPVGVSAMTSVCVANAGVSGRATAALPPILPDMRPSTVRTASSVSVSFVNSGPVVRKSNGPAPRGLSETAANRGFWITTAHSAGI